MSGHNNPIKLALWESLRINSSLTQPDLVVSIGTGTRTKIVSPRLNSFRHILFDGFIPRLWRGYMSSFDGESNYRDVVNNLKEDNRDAYKRLNTLLPTKEPGIDNTSRMGELRESVHSDSILQENCEETVYALLVTSFYFELDSLPKAHPGGRLLCSGMIRCRLPGEVIIKLLEQLHPFPLSFTTHSRTLGYHHGNHDLCLSCTQYRKHVKFTVRDLDQPITLYARSAKRLPRKISAFPQAMRWFISQQGLDTPFGTLDHRIIQHPNCDSCSLTANEHPRFSEKRKALDQSEHPRKKIRAQSS